MFIQALHVYPHVLEWARSRVGFHCSCVGGMIDWAIHPFARSTRQLTYFIWYMQEKVFELCVKHFTLIGCANMNEMLKWGSPVWFVVVQHVVVVASLWTGCGEEQTCLRAVYACVDRNTWGYIALCYSYWLELRLLRVVCLFMGTMCGRHCAVRHYSLPKSEEIKLNSYHLLVVADFFFPFLLDLVKPFY